MSKRETYHTTRVDFSLFKRECLKWIDKFNLNNWEWHFNHVHSESNRAWFNTDFHSHSVSVSLSTKWKHLKPASYEIKKAAFHEICEVLLFPIEYLGESRFLTENEMEPEIHSIVRILEKLIFNGE